MQIIGAYTKEFSEARNRLIHGKFNGAYYYAKEIEENIIPLVKTDRPWDLLGKRSTGSFVRRSAGLLCHLSVL